MNALLNEMIVSRGLALFAGSLAIAAVLSAGMGLGLAWMLRRKGAPVRYGLLLAALSVAVCSPLLIGLAQRANLGWVEIASAKEVIERPVEQGRAATEGGTRQAVAAEGGFVEVRNAETPRGRAWGMIVVTALCAVWMVGIGVGMLRMSWSVVRLRRFMLTLRKCGDRGAVAMLRRAAGMLGLRRVPALCESELLPVPMVMGLWRPVVVMPSGLLKELSPDRLEAIILHETAHIAHGDLWIGLFQRLAGVLLWWCPLVHALNRRLSDLREDICDNYVVQVQGDGLGLAEVLLELAQRTRRAGLGMDIGAMGVVDERPGLEGRVLRLMQQRRNVMTRMNRLALVGTLCFGTIVGAVILATTLRAADEKTPAKMPLGAKEFWDGEGSKLRHELDEATVAEVKKIAADEKAEPALRLRATKLACDLAGNSRVHEKINAADGAKAMAAAMKHIEGNLRDETVRKFSPQLGITHLTVSLRNDDAAIWVLIESVEASRRGGLNVQVERELWKVKKVEHWGKAAKVEAMYFASVAVTVTEGGKLKTDIQGKLAGEQGKPLKSVMGGSGGPTVNVEIKPMEEEGQRQYLVDVKIMEGEKVISSPRVVVLADREANVAIGNEGGDGIKVAVTVHSIDPEKKGVEPRPMPDLKPEMDVARNRLERTKKLFAAGMATDKELAAAELELQVLEINAGLPGPDGKVAEDTVLAVYEVQLRAAKADLERVRKLMQAGVGPVQEVERAEAQVARLKKLVDSRRMELKARSGANR